MPAEFDPQAYSPQRTAIYLGTTRNFFTPLFWVLHRMTYSGRENIPQGPFVAVGNHLSYVDPPLLSAALDRPIVYLAKKELYRMLGTRQFCMFFGAISVDRENPEVSTFKAVKQAMRQGWCLGMFIEGTRSKTPGVLGLPHNGPAYFARLNKVPIVPIGIIGTDKLFGKGRVVIGKPIEAGHDLDETSWRVLTSLSELTGFSLPPKPEAVSST
jgi:1-acyl-sn-glycerol-3-phosphate acyltransferase